MRSARKAHTKFLRNWIRKSRYNTGEIIVINQVQKYMDGPRLLRMRLSEYIPQLSTRNVDLVPLKCLIGVPVAVWDGLYIL